MNDYRGGWHMARLDIRFWHIADSFRELAARPLLGVRRTLL